MQSQNKVAYTIEASSGQTGIALFVYEYRKQEVMTCKLYTTPNIAEDVIQVLKDNDNSPSDLYLALVVRPKRRPNDSIAIEEAIKQATTLICQYA